MDVVHAKHLKVEIIILVFRNLSLREASLSFASVLSRPYTCLSRVVSNASFVIMCLDNCEKLIYMRVATQTWVYTIKNRGKVLFPHLRLCIIVNMNPTVDVPDQTIERFADTCQFFYVAVYIFFKPVLFSTAFKFNIKSCFFAWKTDIDLWLTKYVQMESSCKEIFSQMKFLIPGAEIWGFFSPHPLDDGPAQLKINFLPLLWSMVPFFWANHPRFYKKDYWRFHPGQKQFIKRCLTSGMEAVKPKVATCAFKPTFLADVYYKWSMWTFCEAKMPSSLNSVKIIINLSASLTCIIRVTNIESIFKVSS